MAKVTQRSGLGNGGSPQDGTGYQRKHIHVHSSYLSDTSAVPSSVSPLDHSDPDESDPEYDHSDPDESDSEYDQIDAKLDSIHNMLVMLLQAQEQKQKQVFNLNAIDGPVSPPLSVSVAANPADADAAPCPSPTNMVTFYVPIRLATQPCMPTEVEYHDLAADDDDDNEDFFPSSATELRSDAMMSFGADPDNCAEGCRATLSDPSATSSEECLYSHGFARCMHTASYQPLPPLPAFPLMPPHGFDKPDYPDHDDHDDPDCDQPVHGRSELERLADEFNALAVDLRWPAPKPRK